MPKPKRAAPAAKKKSDLIRQANLVSEQNRERMRALQANSLGRGMADDSDSSDDGK